MIEFLEELVEQVKQREGLQYSLPKEEVKLSYVKCVHLLDVIVRNYPDMEVEEIDDEVRTLLDYDDEDLDYGDKDLNDIADALVEAYENDEMGGVVWLDGSF